MTDEIQSALGTNILMDGIALGEIYDPPTIGANGEEIDTTAQNNVDGVKSKLIGLIDHDNATFNLKYNGSTQQNNLLAEIYDREMHTWSMVFPPDFHSGGHSFPWSGQIQSAKLVHEGVIAHIELAVTVNAKMTPITTLGAGLTSTFFTIVDDDVSPNALTPVPAAAAAIYEYAVEAYSDNTSILITPTATAGTIRVNDTIVVSGAASTAITLNTGNGAVTMVSITVTELNKTPRIYWLRVYLGPTAHP
jgi:hypothetical protein